jgi:hypothetical protein
LPPAVLWARAAVPMINLLEQFGLLWAAGKKMIAKRLHFRFDRAKNIELTAANALLMLFQFV